MFSSLSKPFLPGSYSVRCFYGCSRIGNRPVVGHGCNGSPVYKDDAHFPFPAIRFLETTREVAALRLKELGDWRMLTCEEKKALYRASFCQTFAEFQHGTGQWKFVWGCVFITTSFAFWCQMFFAKYVRTELPDSLKPENQAKQLRRMIELKVNPIDGLYSLWNVDNDDWKRNVPGFVKKEVLMAKPTDLPE